MHELEEFPWNHEVVKLIQKVLSARKVVTVEIQLFF